MPPMRTSAAVALALTTAALIPIRDINERLFSSFAVDTDWDDFRASDLNDFHGVDLIGDTAEEARIKEAGHVW